MTKNPSLGDGVAIDVERLIEGRLLLQANSGGGKSHTLRRLLEQTAGACQQIVIDPEGEFHTLREGSDYILAGPGGDCPADLRSAALLARRLLDVGASAIVDIYELGAKRQKFVELFLTSLMSAPRNLWHPAIIVLDEANAYCEEGSKSDCAAAVIELMTRGRKRGFCGVLATQRIATLSKSAAAECNNKLIGRCGLDVDRTRAGKELGFSTKEQVISLRDLAPGEFYAFGAAMSVTGVQRFRVGDVATTHPKAGQRAAPPAPPSAKIKKLLAQLADLPAEAEEEARTAVELRAQVKRLEVDLRQARAAAPAPERIEVQVSTITPAEWKRLDDAVARVASVEESVCDELQAVGVVLTDIRATIELSKQLPPKVKPIAPPAPLPQSRGRQLQSTSPRSPSVDLPIGERATLAALIQYPAGLRREQLTVLTAYKRSTRDAYIARLRERGFVDTSSERVIATSGGIAALPDATPLPVGVELQAFWLAKLPIGEKACLEHLIREYPGGIERSDLDELTGFKRSTRDAYLSRLAAKELVYEAGRGAVKASSTLFGVAS